MSPPIRSSTSPIRPACRRCSSALPPHRLRRSAMHHYPDPPEGFVLYRGGKTNGAAATDAAWPEIDHSLFDDRRAAVPRFPMDVLPPAWAQWVDDTAQAAGTPVDYVAQGVLAAVAAVCGAGVATRVMPSWTESLVLWQALVGTPSSGKSPAPAVVRRLLDQIEADPRA